MIEIIPVGGYSEIGKNMTAIKVDDEVVILDMGIHLPNYIEYTEKLFNLDLLKEEFQTMEFQSMLEESYLSDYEDTFKTLL